MKTIYGSFFGVMIAFFCSELSGAASAPKKQEPRLLYIGAYSCTVHDNLAVTPREQLTVTQLSDLIQHTAAVKADALKQVNAGQGNKKNECGCGSKPKLFLYTPDGAVVMIDQPGTAYTIFSFKKDIQHK